MSINDQSQSLELVEPSALEVMERASIDVQIATARKYPRTLSQVKQQMLSFATLDPETAAGCFYTLPPRRGAEDNKRIQGPSIRMAEIALSSFGNIRAGARVIADDGKMLTAQGVCHDLQNNVSVSVEVKRRVTRSNGSRYSDDMVAVTGNAACAIALRNAVFKVVPLALVKPIYEQAIRVAIGDQKTLVQRRAASMEHFAKLGITKDRVFAAVEVKGLDDIGLEQLEVLIGFSNAIRDGEAKIDDVFPDPATAKVASGPAGGIVAAAGGESPKPTSENPASVPTPAASQATESQAPAATEESRDKVIGDLKNVMLDRGVSESSLFDYAKKIKSVPEGIDELFTLPTATLSKLIHAAKAMGKNGGAK